MALSSRPADFSVRKLYLSSFPPVERFPFLFLQALSLRRSCSFLSWYDGEVRVGISYTIEGPDMVFLLYLAVEPSLRSKGYGREILSALRFRYQKPLTLNSEVLDASAENIAERRRRFSFYERNGFSDTGYELVEEKMTYTVLSDADAFSLDVYRQTLLGLHPFGIGMPVFSRRK